MRKIVINGQSYDRIANLPPDLRRLYDQTMGALPDQNQDGIPDMLEGLLAQAKVGAPNAAIHQSVQTNAARIDD